MKMADVKVGMRLAAPNDTVFSPIVVTKITAQGFEYKLANGPRCIHPRLGITILGGECLGDNGETWYEPCPSHSLDAATAYWFPNHPVVPTEPAVFDDSEEDRDLPWFQTAAEVVLGLIISAMFFMEDLAS